MAPSRQALSTCRRKLAVFDSLLDVPLDKYKGNDGDDQLVPNGGEKVYQPSPRRSLATAVSPPDPHLAVPYFYLKRGSHGRPVVALVRALSVAGHGAWKGMLFSSLFGVFAERNLNAFKKKFGLPQNGVYDRAAHAYLAPYYDPYAIVFLLAPEKKPPIDVQKRNWFLAELMFLYNRRTYVRYSQERPFDTDKPPGALDCSSSGEWAAKWASMKSLSGFTGFGYGNTDSQILHYRRVGGVRSAGISAAKIGDPLYYGRGTDPSHVAFFIGGGRVWSFGGYPAKILDASYRHDRIAVCDLLAGQG